jgi:predicted transcriptional regulator
MRTITVTLPDDVADEIERMANTGDWVEMNEHLGIVYHPAGGERVVTWTNEELKREIQRGLEDCKEGRLIDGEEFMERWMAETDGQIQ